MVQQYYLFPFLDELLLLTVILLSVQSLLWPHRHPPHLLLFPHCAWPFIHPAPVASLFPEPEPEPGPGAYVHQPCLDACACTCTCARHLSASPSLSLAFSAVPAQSHDLQCSTFFLARILPSPCFQLFI